MAVDGHVNVQNGVVLAHVLRTVLGVIISTPLIPGQHWLAQRLYILRHIPRISFRHTLTNSLVHSFSHFRLPILAGKKHLAFSLRLFFFQLPRLLLPVQILL